MNMRALVFTGLLFGSCILGCTNKDNKSESSQRVTDSVNVKSNANSEIIKSSNRTLQMPVLREDVAEFLSIKNAQDSVSDAKLNPVREHIRSMSEKVKVCMDSIAKANPKFNKAVKSMRKQLKHSV